MWKRFETVMQMWVWSWSFAFGDCRKRFKFLYLTIHISIKKKKRKASKFGVEIFTSCMACECVLKTPAPLWTPFTFQQDQGSYRRIPAKEPSIYRDFKDFENRCSLIFFLSLNRSQKMFFVRVAQLVVSSQSQ